MKTKISDINSAIRLRLAFILLFVLILEGVSGQAVSDSPEISLGYPVYSQYLQNGLMINPAYTGSRGALSGFLSYRMQWMGTKGSPVIQSLSLHSPMKNNKVALGLLAQFMQFGFTKSTSIYASYAYRIQLSKGIISMGIKGGADLSNTNFSGILLANPADRVFTSNDKPYVLPNVGAGVYYNSEKLFAGFSIPFFFEL